MASGIYGLHWQTGFFASSSLPPLFPQESRHHTKLPPDFPHWRVDDLEKPLGLDKDGGGEGFSFAARTEWERDAIINILPANFLPPEKNLAGFLLPSPSLGFPT